MAFTRQCILILSVSFFSIDALKPNAPKGITIAPFFRLHHLDPPSYSGDRPSAEDQWFEQRLDHFNALNPTTWQQRYFSSFEYYEEGGPVFLYVGGEAAISDHWLHDGAWIEWAKEQKAALFMLEHRYYGRSHPTPSITTEELVWLSSRQGQNDLATFIDAMKMVHGFSGPWIAFGGSYPGSMAAWVREKYPHLIQGSVSSSGPLLAKVNFIEYLEVVYEAMGRDGPECNDAITEGIAALEMMVDDASVWGKLQESFELCSPFDGTKPGDQAFFLGSIVAILQGAVQYDWNGSYNISDVCEIMKDQEIGTPLERLSALNSFYLPLAGMECLDYTYQSFLDMLGNSEYDSDGVGYRQWIYQTCTEFGWYQSSDQPDHPYGTKFPLEFSIKMCQELFGEIFTLEYIEAMAQGSNDYYGAKDLNVNNVVFVHGSIDPWHAMGRITDLNENSPAILIPGTSHCVDMYANAPGDPEELVAARKTIGELVDKWVKEA